MSLTELKEQVAGLSRKDRFQLSVYLAELEQETEQDFRAEVGRRMNVMDAGAKVTAEKFEERHQKAKAKGR